MSRKPQRRSLEAVAKRILAPLLPPSQPPDGWTVLSWDCEQGLCISFQRDRETIYVEVEPRNDSLPCYSRTERFNVNARPQQSETRDVGPGGRPLMEWVVAGLREAETEFPAYERVKGTRRGALREILVDQVLVPEFPGHYYINPYVGCVIGCSFCYVGPRADMSRHLEGLPHLPWGQYVDVKVNAAEVLAREVLQHEPGIVRMSPILTDPYQPPERKYRITRQCLEVLLGAGYSPVILTRAKRIVEDLDLLRQFPKAIVGFSIPTDDDKYRAIFEPGADPIEDRIEGLRAMHEAGLPTMVVIQPMLPMNPERLVELIGPYTTAVRIDRMHFDFSDALYREHGIEWAMQREFFVETRERLLAAFRSYDVQADELDDLAHLMASKRARPPSG